MLIHIIFRSFNIPIFRLSVPGALPMNDLLPYTDIALDIHTHALYSARHSTATSRFPGIKPTPTAVAVASSTDPCVLQSSPVSLLPTDEDICEYVVDAKNVLADCLESFFPTPRTKSIRVCNTPTPCPFWIAARTSIRALRESPLKGPLTHGLGLESKNGNNIFSHLDLEDVSEYVLKKVPQDVTPTSTWNVLHLAVRSGCVDVLRYLLNVPQVPGSKGVDDGYIGSVQQLLKGRKVAVNKPSLCLCACYYNQSTALDVLRSYQYFLSKGPSDGVGRDSFLALSSSPKKRRAVSLSRAAAVLHLSPAIEFKLSSKLHFEASNSDFSLLELSAYTGNEESFCYLLQSTDSKYTEEDILAVWATVTACIRCGCLSESCLLLAVTWVLERVTKADRSASDALNDSVHLDDFDDVIEVLKKESILSLACSLAVVTAPPADTMRYPNRYRNRNSVTGKSTVQSAVSGVSARNSGKDDQDSTGPFQETVLHLACRRGLLLLVRVMLQYGANPRVRDSTVSTSISSV
jgi:Ankyrin repeat